jgi:hypothetical protein
MSRLSYKVFCWFAWKHPVLTSNWQSMSMRFSEWRWKRYMKRHRICCEDSLIKHCANKLVVNSKKACCYAYLPDRCETCGRRIPKRILCKYMMLSYFIEEYEEQKKVCRKAHH